MKARHPMMPKKTKKCRKCQKEFSPRNGLQVACSPVCAIALAKEKNGKKRKKAFNAETRRRKEAMKTKADWLNDVQKVFNAYIRKVDEGRVCISCQKPPKKKNAGHYLSVGSHPELRFEVSNCHLQCEHCNTFKSGNQAQYRIHLIEKIGIKQVEWLEGPHEPKHYTIPDLIELKAYFRRLLKIATRGRAA